MISEEDLNKLCKTIAKGPKASKTLNKKLYSEIRCIK